MDYEIDYKHIYNGSPDMCVSAAAGTGQIVECNQTVIDMLGYSKEEVLSKTVLQMYHESELEKVKENLQSFTKTGKIIHTDFKLLKKDGGTIEVSLKFTPVKDQDGNIIYSNAVWRDVTEIKKVQRALQAEKEKVESKNKIIEAKNKNILASINYAKRIQTAILPPDKVVKEYLLNSFVLYKPKDIVAGDFYWMESSKDSVLFAAADCTGHGVPGAMVSVVCNNALNRSVREFDLLEPGRILDKTREIVMQEFEKSEEEVKDGMDIALCCLTGTQLQFAGAHNPLWIVRSGDLIEVKADRQPIGNFVKPTPFNNHVIDLRKGDIIYVFSDGFVDQFGGEEGKKYKTKNFKNLLIRISSLSMSHQRIALDNEFEQWRGNHEQLDDVCVIGVQV